MKHTAEKVTSNIPYDQCEKVIQSEDQMRNHIENNHGTIDVSKTDSNDLKTSNKVSFAFRGN